MSLLRGQACRGRSHYPCDFLTVFLQVVCMPAPVFLVLGKPPEGMRWTFLKFHPDLVHSLPELGPPCNTWAKSMWHRGLSQLLADFDSPL